jgi:hypothetical protein
MEQPAVKRSSWSFQTARVPRNPCGLVGLPQWTCPASFRSPFIQAESSASPSRVSVFDALTTGNGDRLLLQGDLRITSRGEKTTDFDWKSVLEANQVRAG